MVAVSILLLENFLADCTSCTLLETFPDSVSFHCKRGPGFSTHILNKMLHVSFCRHNAAGVQRKISKLLSFSYPVWMGDLRKRMYNPDL